MSVERMRVYGVCKSKGNYEGTDYDSAKVHCLLPLKPDPSNSGFAGVIFKGLPDVYKKWVRDDFYPETGLLFDVEIQKVSSSGGDMSEMIYSMTLVPGQQTAVDLALAAASAQTAAASAQTAAASAQPAEASAQTAAASAKPKPSANS